MRLCDLPWEKREWDYRFYTYAAKVGALTVLYAPHYDLYAFSEPGGAHYYDLPPLEAQCVLYWFLGGKAPR